MFVNKRYLGALVGNTMQFYDFTIYAFLTTEISQAFFNFQNKFLSYFVVFSIFASGYLARPLGSLIFGYFGDKKGRSNALSKTIIISAMATFAIGILPNYQSIGLLAPIMLILLRLIQGLAVSGEEGGAVVLLFERYAFKHKGVIGASVLSSVLVGVILGIVVCSTTSHLISSHSIGAWAWRLPFILSLPLGIAAIFLRFYLNDFRLFAIAEQNNALVQQPTRTLFRNHSRALLYGFFIVAIYSMTTSLLIVHMPYYLNVHLHFSHDVSLMMVAVAILLIAGLMPLVGKYCDLFNPESVYRFGTLGVIALSPLLFYALSLHQLYFIMTVMLIYAGLIACISSAIFSILVGLFPFGVRYSGVSLAFNLGVTVFSSSTPLALMSVEKYYASSVAPGIYMSLCAVLALMISHCLKKKISVLRFNEHDQEKMIYQCEG